MIPATTTKIVHIMIFWRQLSDTDFGEMPVSTAASFREADIRHSWDLIPRHMTGLAEVKLGLRLVGRAHECSMFWVGVTYSKFSNRLLDGLPSLWWTCHATG